MKCRHCGSKVFRNIVDKDGRVGSWRMCANCNTLHDFVAESVFKINQSKKNRRGAFEYDFEN